MSTVIDDFDRLWSMIGGTLLHAVALAFGSATILAMLILPLTFVAFAAMLPFVAWFHGIFIVAIIWKHLHPGEPLGHCIASPGLAGGGILGVAILLFAFLDAPSGSYFCADGAVQGRSVVPDLPWLWIGWLALTIGIAPIWSIGLVIGEMPPVIPILRRALLCLPFVPFIVFFGFAFQWREIDCSPPVGGWGLFEGGLFAAPFLALFWFVSSLSMAAVTATSIDEAGLEEAEPQDDVAQGS